MNNHTLKAFQHGQLLSIRHEEYRAWVLSFLNLLLQQDKKEQDITAKKLFPDGTVKMQTEIVAQEAGIVAGLEELSLFCKSKNIKTTAPVNDGKPVRKGEVVVRRRGPVGKLLETERLTLDLLGRMSGIATHTSRLVNKIKNIHLAATRKTLWGPLDKKAVYLGGGLTHRLGLWQAVLIKDNHLTALKNTGARDPMKEALNRTAHPVSTSKIPFLEIEVESAAQANRLIMLFEKHSFPGFVPAILLDNFSPDQVKSTLNFLKERKLREKIIVEVSGGISEKNLQKYAGTGADLISMGSLTHSAKALDFSERMIDVTE